MQPAILRAFGWRFALVLTKDWYHNPDDVLARIEKLLQGQEIPDAVETADEEPVEALAQSPAPIPEPLEAPPAAAPTPVPTPAAAPGAARRFEFQGGSSQKFWEIALSGNSFTVRFGRIGTAGQSQSKTFPDVAKASREADALIVEKLKKGYVEINT